MTPGSRPDLEWIRFFAALEVVICHSDLAIKHFSGAILSSPGYSLIGGLGVEVFFVLSGYLMCLRAHSYGCAWHFVCSRYLRIIPLYWIFTSLVIVARVLNPDWSLNGQNLSPDLVLRSYLILPQSWYPLLGVGWSLEHEVIFYGLVGLWIAIASRFGPFWVEFGVGLFVLGWCGIIFAVPPSDAAWYLHPLSVLMTAFGIGWLYRCYEASKNPMFLRTLLACLAISAGLIVILEAANLTRVSRIIVAGALFILAVRLRFRIAMAGRVNKILVPLGEATYSIYLSHWFVLSVFGKVAGRVALPEALQLPMRMLAIALSLLVGLLVFRIIERPLDRWLRHGLPIREAFGDPFRREPAVAS